PPASQPLHFDSPVPETGTGNLALVEPDCRTPDDAPRPNPDSLPGAVSPRPKSRFPSLTNSTSMARWPDNWRSNLVALLMIFVILPLLCALAWWYVRG